MPLHLLVPLVVGGIFAIMIATIVMGMNKPRRFESEADAAYAWGREYPGIPARNTIRASDGGAALIETDNGLGLVWAIGADTTARPLRDAEVTATDTGLIIALHDYSAPDVHVTLDAQEVRDWTARIEGSA